MGAPAIIRTCLVAGAILLAASGASGDADHTVVLSGVAPAGVDGGEHPIDAHDDVSPAQRAAISARLRVVAQALADQGVAQGSAAPVKFGWPLAPAPHLDAPGYHGVSNFVDRNPAFPNAVQDYNCGTRTYDLASGYNHSGIDFFLWPFAWNKMDGDDVHVVAAAAGTILDKEDGNYDRNCDLSNPYWNAVYVAHADGTVAWYGHLKRGSLTTKNVGDPIAQGEYVGVVGSSGSSTGPHLHFEVHDGNGDVIDPYEGACNPLSGGSMWAEQRPYYDSAINEITTGAAPVVLGNCPAPSTPNRQDVFARGSTVYFTSYYRDQRSTQTALHTIYRPDGSIYSSWSQTPSTPHYSASYWYWYFTGFAAAGPTGTWRYEIVFEGVTYAHALSIVDPESVPTSTPTITRTPSATPTDTRTRSVTPTRTSTRTPTATFTPSLTRTPSNTPTMTATRTATATRTLTATPSATATSTATQTQTVTPSVSPTQTETATVEPPATFTMTASATTTDTPTPTQTVTISPSATATATSRVTATDTYTHTPTLTATIVIEVTPTPRAASTLAPSTTATAVETATVPPSPSATVTSPETTATVPVASLCVGDCGADGTVTVNDLVRAVNIALGRVSLNDCPAATRDGNAVVIADLVAGVNNALRGCPL